MFHSTSSTSKADLAAVLERAHKELLEKITTLHQEVQKLNHDINRSVHEARLAAMVKRVQSLPDHH